MRRITVDSSRYATILSAERPSKVTGGENWSRTRELSTFGTICPGKVRAADERRAILVPTDSPTIEKKKKEKRR